MERTFPLKFNIQIVSDQIECVNIPLTKQDNILRHTLINMCTHSFYSYTNKINITTWKIFYEIYNDTNDITKYHHVYI